MLTKMALGFSILANIALIFAVVLWVRGRRQEQTVLDYFTHAIAVSAVGVDAGCVTGKKNEQGFCREGTQFWRALKRVAGESARPVGASEIPTQQEALLMWGLAFSAGSESKTLFALAPKLKAGQAQFLADGLGFGWTLLRGRPQAISGCAALNEFAPMCRYGIGRAEFFLNLAPLPENQEERAGAAFAEHYSGETSPGEDQESVLVRKAIQLADGMVDIQKEPCLGANHVVACVRDAK